jgi:hypothetical protein
VQTVSSVPFKLRFDSDTFTNVQDHNLVGSSFTPSYSFSVPPSTTSWLSLDGNTRTFSGVPPNVNSVQDVVVTLKAYNPNLPQYPAEGYFTITTYPASGMPYLLFEGDSIGDSIATL